MFIEPNRESTLNSIVGNEWLKDAAGELYTAAIPGNGRNLRDLALVMTQVIICRDKNINDNGVSELISTQNNLPFYCVLRNQLNEYNYKPNHLKNAEFSELQPLLFLTPLDHALNQSFIS